jgi:hypothetical protein
MSTTYVERLIKCTRCFGRGVRYEHSRRGSGSTYVRTCPGCGGRGERMWKIRKDFYLNVYWTSKKESPPYRSANSPLGYPTLEAARRRAMTILKTHAQDIAYTEVVSRVWDPSARDPKTCWQATLFP